MKLSTRILMLAVIAFLAFALGCKSASDSQEELPVKIDALAGVHFRKMAPNELGGDATQGWIAEHKINSTQAKEAIELQFGSQPEWEVQSRETVASARKKNANTDIAIVVFPGRNDTSKSDQEDKEARGEWTTWIISVRGEN